MYLSLKAPFVNIGTGTAHCSSHQKPLRILVPPKTFAPTGQGRLRQRYIARRKNDFPFQGVSHIPFASIGYHSQRFALLF